MKGALGVQAGRLGGGGQLRHRQQLLREERQEELQEAASDRVCAYSERHGMRCAQTDCGDPGELPAGRWDGGCTACTAAVHWRPRRDPAPALMLCKGLLWQ